MNERIKKLRKNLKLSMKKFGEKLGVQASAINKIEKGENGVTEQNIRLICREFNVSEEWLRYGTGEMFKEYSDEVAIVNIKERLIGAITVMSDDDALKLWNYIKERCHNERKD